MIIAITYDGGGLMNLTQLEFFVSVSELHSFTKAAEKHFVSQTAVTQQIQKLEELLQTTLFDRSKRPVQLTNEGMIFLLEAKAILERMYGAMAKMAVAANTENGILRIGYVKGYERSALSDLLREYRRGHPNVLLSCHRQNSTQLVKALVEGELDLIFTWEFDPALVNTRISCRKVGEYDLEAVLYPTHPFVSRTSLRREDLCNEKLLYLSPSNSLQDDAYLRLYRKAGYEPDIVHCTDDAESILMMVAAEEGISIMPSYITRILPHTDGLVRVVMRGEEEKAVIMAAWNEQRPQKLLTDFLTYLSENGERIFCPGGQPLWPPLPL